MRFDVRPILHAPGKRLTFQFSLDLSDVEFAGRHPISRPVEVESAVSNTADLLELELTARTTLDAVCDRCGKAFLQDKTVPFRCLLAEELQNEDNDEIVLLDCACGKSYLSFVMNYYIPRHCVRKIAKDCAPGAVPT